jgi:tRNA (cmo5U34)-methyltransferase
MPHDEVMPADRWRFDGDVTEVFDDMLERCIPQYGVMRAAVDAIAARFICDGSTVVDLGCSRGGAIARLVERSSPSVNFIGVEVSQPMLAAARKRFEGKPNVRIEECDLRLMDYPVAPSAAVTLAILCMMFIPIEHRIHVVWNVRRHTRPGGAFIMVEKVLGADAELDSIMVGEYLAMKARNGYTQEQIDRKRLALEGVLVPVPASWNVEMLHAAGFERVDCFWRWMNFAGWVAM